MVYDVDFYMGEVTSVKSPELATSSIGVFMKAYTGDQRLDEVEVNAKYVMSASSGYM